LVSAIQFEDPGRSSFLQEQLGLAVMTLPCLVQDGGYSMCRGFS